MDLKFISAERAGLCGVNAYYELDGEKVRVGWECISQDGSIVPFFLSENEVKTDCLLTFDKVYNAIRLANSKDNPNLDLFIMLESMFTSEDASKCASGEMYNYGGEL